MDLQIALLSAGVCLLCAVVVYFISWFGIREKTYEEAIEEQRKRNQEAAQHNKVEKPKKEKKFKKQGKRVKESRNSEEEAEPTTNHVNEHVEFKPDAEIIPLEPDPDTKPQKSKKKVKTPKSILLNKQEVGPVVMEPPSISDDDKDVQDSPPAFVPMDEVERRHSLDIGQKKLAMLLQNTVALQEAASVPLEVKTTVTETKAQPSEIKLQTEVVQEKKHEEVTKKNKKQRSESFENETEPSFKKLMGTIKKLALVDEEIQTLIDVLLNKQQGGTEWHKKNDPVATLKKQLAERETALEGEQRASQTANNKLREIRQEITLEKTRTQTLERTLRQELQTVHSRMQAILDQQTKTQQAHSKALEEQGQALQCLKEEKLSLQQQLQLVEVERQKWAAHEREIQREIEERYQATLVQEKERMNLQVQAKESQLQQVLAAQQEGDYKCSQAITDLKQKLQESQSQFASLSQEVDATRQRFEEKDMLLRKKDEEQQRIKRMTEEERLKLQSQADVLQGQLKNANNQMQDFDRQVAKARQESDSLRKELAKAQEQKQSLEARGDTHNAHLQQENNMLITRLSEAEKALEQLQKDLTGVNSELESQKGRNNDLHERNWKAMDALSKLEESTKDKEKNQLKELVQVRQEHEKELMQVRQQLQQELQKSKEEGRENQNAFSMDDLQRIQEEERSCLQRLLPDVQIDSSLKHSTWIERFAECVRENLASTETFRGENDALSLQVNHYQTVLSDTESMLKNLQKRVEDQESQWTERLSRKDTETAKILQEKAVLEEQLQQLQGIEEATAEMQGRLKELQAKLQGEESEKKQIETKAEEAEQRCASLSTELENSNQEVARLRQEVASTENVKSQVDGLQKDLEKERKITKELGSQVVKLNSIIKIGQDSLKAEQELVKQLESQVTPCANGNNNNNNNNNNKIPADNGTAVENDCASTPVRTDKPNKGKKRGGPLIKGCFR